MPYGFLHAHPCCKSGSGDFVEISPKPPGGFQLCVPQLLTKWRTLIGSLCKPDNIILPWCVAQSTNWTSQMGSRKTEHLLFIAQTGTGFDNGVGTGKGWRKDNSIWLNVAQDSVLYLFVQNYFYTALKRRTEAESLEKMRCYTIL